MFDLKVNPIHFLYFHLQDERLETFKINAWLTMVRVLQCYRLLLMHTWAWFHKAIQSIVRQILQYHHSDLYCDITLHWATTIDLQLRSILALCEIGRYNHNYNPVGVMIFNITYHLSLTKNCLLKTKKIQFKQIIKYSDSTSLGSSFKQ